jgi:uncharacterized protein YuzB (UPF0349 family)
MEEVLQQIDVNEDGRVDYMEYLPLFYCCCCYAATAIALSSGHDNTPME